MKRLVTHFVTRLPYWGVVLLLTFVSVTVSVMFLMLQHYIAHGTFQSEHFLSGFITSTGIAVLFSAVAAYFMRRCQAPRYPVDEAHARLQMAQNIAQFGFWEYSPNSDHIYWSDEIYRIFGVDTQRAPANFESFFDIVHPDDRSSLLEAYHHSVKERRPCHTIHRIVRDDGTLRYVEGRCQHTFNDDGDLVKSVGSLYDVTDKVADRNKLQRLFDLQKNIIIQSSGNSISTVNRSFLDFFELNSLEEFTQNYSCICEHFIEDERFFHMGKVPEQCHWTECMEQLPEKERIVSIKDTEGHAHLFSVTINHFDMSDSIITLTDISETMLEQFQLEQQINHDALTGAYNRNFFNGNIAAIMEALQDDHRQLGIILFDIDHFKRINDSYGHDVGDQVLIELVRRVKRFVRSHDRLIRWGGEEFLLVLDAECIATLRVIAENIRQHIEEAPFEGVGTMTCSFGLTLHRWEETIEQSIKQADIALYEAKNGGRNLVVAK